MAIDLVDDQSINDLLRASQVFGHLGTDALDRVRSALEPRVVRDGEVLMRLGDAADGLYFVASGRLQIVIERADGTTAVVNEVGRGDVVGEMALLTDSPRSATIVALRESHVLFLGNDAFARVVRAHPDALRSISGVLISKLMHTIRFGSTTTPATSITLVPLDDSEAVRELGDRLARSLERFLGAVPVVPRGPHARRSRRVVSASAGHMARATRGLARRGRVRGRRNMRRVDRRVRRSFGSHRAGRVGRRAESLACGGSRAEPAPRCCDSPLRARLVAPAGNDHTAATRRWLTERKVDRHHHVRVDRAGDYDRVARLLAGRGIGVVFSGGGARGIAHVGVLEALHERGITIDATAGASIGAIVAGAVARGDGPDDIAAQLRAAVVDRSPVDLTFPGVSLAAGKRVTHHITNGARGIDLEDTWLNFLCVSTNLTRGALEIHTQGPAWTAIRSSFSVPGLFPPMRNDVGDVLVDGGILDNMPVTPLPRDALRHHGDRGGRRRTARVHLGRAATHRRDLRVALPCEQPSSTLTRESHDTAPHPDAAHRARFPRRE